MAIFNSYVSHYQRVNLCETIRLGMSWDCITASAIFFPKGFSRYWWIPHLTKEQGNDKLSDSGTLLRLLVDAEY